MGGQICERLRIVRNDDVMNEEERNQSGIQEFGKWCVGVLVRDTMGVREKRSRNLRLDF